MQITFLGAVGTVTGSKHLVEAAGRKILIDCGLYQGLKELRLRNWQSLPFSPKELDAVVLTHAHIDHSGYLPLLVRDGFKGPIYCSAPTRDLCHILLPDCAKINEEDAAYANRKGFSKHAPALPLYTEADALACLAQLKAVEIDKPQRVGEVEFSLRPVGHILGACTVTLRHADASVLFSGDVGRYTDLVEKPPATPEGAEVVVMESTYGDRRHSEASPIAELASLVNKIIAQQGVLLIPAFALGRAQVLLYCLYRVFKEGLAERIPVFLNSPMASKVSNLYQGYAAWQRLSAEESEGMFALPTYIKSVEESIALNNKKGPMVIISASGMVTGGRILHHLKKFAPDPRTIILLPGFQAPGTRGRALIEGSKTLKMHGDQIAINAKVMHWENISAHGDQHELLRWLGSCAQMPKRIFLVHGDPGAAEALSKIIHEKTGIAVVIPTYGARVEI